MSEFLYLVEKRLPKKPGKATILRVQNGPVREDTGSDMQFENIISVRCPASINLDNIEPGTYINIVTKNQGTKLRKGTRTFEQLEAVAIAVRPAAAWQLGLEGELYDFVPNETVADEAEVEA